MGSARAWRRLPTPWRWLPGPTARWSLGLAGLLAAVVVWSATVGPADVGAAAVVAIVLDAVPLVPVEAGQDWSHRFIVLEYRLPRIALAAAVGFALATAGTVMQGFFRNPMADPSIVGVSSGAALGAVSVIVLGSAVPLGVPAAAFVGALLAAFAVYLIATEGGRTPVATLLLAGVAVQTLLGAAVSFLLVRSDDRSLREAVYWMMGTLRNATWEEVLVVVPVAVVGFVVLWAHARDLNVLLLGEADARSLGVAVQRTRRRLLATASVLTGAAVAFVGVVGFVGLIVPHAMRLLVGPDHRRLLPTSALAGATFLVATDTIARSGSTEVPVGILTAAVGVPFFLYLLRRREVHEL